MASGIEAAPSSRRYVAGPTGSGKSHLLRVWAEEFPRQLVLDVTGEWADPDDGEPDPVFASSMRELLEALNLVAGQVRWRIVVPTDRIPADRLADLLVPVHRPGRTSFPRAVGGLALVVDEAAELAGRSSVDKVRHLWLRGRHHGLSILAASQRAADVGRMVTSQSDIIAVTRTDEPLDLAYWRGTLRPAWYAALLELEERQAVVVDRISKSAEIQTTAGELVRELPAGTMAD